MTCANISISVVAAFKEVEESATQIRLKSLIFSARAIEAMAVTSRVLRGLPRPRGNLVQSHLCIDFVCHHAFRLGKKILFLITSIFR